MFYIYPYLEDQRFLKEFDMERVKQYHVKITTLTFDSEEPIASLEGKSTGGNCNLSGTSNMRRTASCSLLVDPNGIHKFGSSDAESYYNIMEVENIISLNKKVRVEIGLKNHLLNDSNWKKYSNYNIIWFPLGVYVIKNAGVVQNNSGINISLTLNDKCALLNGDMGGVIPATTNFSEIEYLNAAGETYKTQKILIKDIIRDLVVNYGGELGENVLISDIPDTAVKKLRWIGSKPLYLITEKNKKQLTTEIPKVTQYRAFNYGQDIGYANEPFTYPGTLEASAGETVSSVLDKIKNTLGHFEWGYDVYGRFFFRMIKDYLNVSLASEFLDIAENDYFAIANHSKSVYTFDESNLHLITSVSSSPQYTNIKNDFVVWGTRHTTATGAVPIRYHLAFDDKTVAGQTCVPAIVYRDSEDVQKIISLKKDNCEILLNAVDITKDKSKDKYYITSSNIFEDNSIMLDISKCTPMPHDDGKKNNVYFLGTLQGLILDTYWNWTSWTDSTGQIYSAWIEETKNFNTYASSPGVKLFLVFPENEDAPKICAYDINEVINDWDTDILKPIFFDEKDINFKYNNGAKVVSFTIPQNFSFKSFKIYGQFAAERPLPADSNDEWKTTANTIINIASDIQVKRTSKTNVFYWNEALDSFTTLSKITLCYLRAREGDWRTELYLRGIAEDNKTFFQSYYTTELKAEWPKICEMLAERTNEQEILDVSGDFQVSVPVYLPQYRHLLDSNNTYYKASSEYEYWIDFLDCDKNGKIPMSQFHVNKIGRRTKVEPNSNANCLFPQSIPNFIYVHANGNTKEDLAMARQNRSQEVIQVKTEIFNKLGVGGANNSAFERIQELLQTHTQYSDSINISCIPIFHLEPNTRITIDNPLLGIRGDYMIKTMTLPLTPDGISSISATRCVEKEVPESMTINETYLNLFPLG